MAEPSDFIDLGKRIRQLRGKDSRSQFAEDFLVAPSSLARWEGGESQPELGFLIRLASANKVSLEWLVTGKEDIPENGKIRADQQFRYLDDIDFISAKKGSSPAEAPLVEYKESREHKESRDNKELQDNKELRGREESRESKSLRYPKESENYRELREIRDSKEAEESKKVGYSKEYGYSREYGESKEPRADIRDDYIACLRELADVQKENGNLREKAARLEAQNADLERRLAEALKPTKPASLDDGTAKAG